MAPLTLIEKYDDLIRCADQPLTSYEKLSNEDFEDIISKKWPFIIQSITYQPMNISEEKNSFSAQIRTRLERRLKIHFPLYSEAAKRHQQKFPNRKPIVRMRPITNRGENDSLSVEMTSTFSLDNNRSSKNVPNFNIFCSLQHSKQVLDCVKKYLIAPTEVSSYKTLVFQQAIQDCCRCGNSYLLNSLCSVMNIPIENIIFDNNDTILHRCIQLNNRQLTEQLIQHRFQIEIDGELGTPLVTAMHYDVLWAVELLLNNGADLTKRHIDWPWLTLYQYCIQFNKIDMKLIIDRYLLRLFRQKKNSVLKNLINNGWEISLKTKHLLSSSYCVPTENNC